MNELAGAGTSTPGPRGVPWPIWLLLVVGVLSGVSWWWATEPPPDQGGVVRAAWLEDYNSAVAKATISGRPILIDFTGSDWCGPCIRLRNEVFDTSVFTTWADGHVVLLKCDFPRFREQSAAIAAQNQQLADRYAIEGFPTILILTAQGEELARVGYRRGGAAVWIADIEETVRRGTTSAKMP